MKQGVLLSFTAVLSLAIAATAAEVLNFEDQFGARFVL